MDLAGCIVSTVIVLGLAYTALAAFRRLQQGPRREQELKFLSALPVGQRERLILVAWRDKTLLLGVTAGAITVIDQGAASAANAPVHGENSDRSAPAGPPSRPAPGRLTFRQAGQRTPIWKGFISSIGMVSDHEPARGYGQDAGLERRRTPRTERMEP
jgi:flagellar biogenesis protein FliO